MQNAGCKMQNERREMSALLWLVGDNFDGAERAGERGRCTGCAFQVGVDSFKSSAMRVIRDGGELRARGAFLGDASERQEIRLELVVFVGASNRPESGTLDVFAEDVGRQEVLEISVERFREVAVERPVRHPARVHVGEDETASGLQRAEELGEEGGAVDDVMVGELVCEVVDRSIGERKAVP